MPRLFIALALPPEVTVPLAALLPASMRGMRRVPPEQMHLTLHFIGEAEIEHIATLIKPVHMQPFSVLINGVGQFSRGTVLWAGVAPEPALLELHAGISQALVQGEIAVETRPYRPHITLARCKPYAPRRVMHDFLEHNAGLELPQVKVSEFALYSSPPSTHGPIYRVERGFPG